jgi:hypothetical protein
MNGSDGNTTSDLVQPDEIEDAKVIKVTSYRWVILATYIGLNGVISLGQNGFSPIVTATSEVVGCSKSYILGIGTSYLILFLPSEILGNYLYKYMKIHHVLILAGIV